MSVTTKLIKQQQHEMAAKALAEWSKKNKRQHIPDMVLHVLNLMVEQMKLKSLDWTVAKIDEMVKRHGSMERSAKKFQDLMDAENKREAAKKKKKPAAKRSPKKK